MKFTFTVLVVIVSSIFVQAGSAEAEKANQFYANEFVSMINENILAEESYPLNTVEVDDRCAKWVNQSNTLGNLGVFINNHIIINQQNFKHLLDSKKSISNICPKYSSLQTNQKSFLWTMILAAMAHYESNCNIMAYTKGPSGRTSGFYQLHRGHESTYDGKLKVCKNFDGTKPEESSICALTMLDLQLKNRVSLFTSKSYWDVLRPSGEASRTSKAPQSIKKAIVNSSLCK